MSSDATKYKYRTWLLISFSTGPVSAILRAYVPAIIQSIVYNVGHEKNNITSHCQAKDSCYIKIFTSEIHYSSFVHFLRSVSTLIEIFVTVVLSRFADTKYKNFCLVAYVSILGFATVMFQFCQKSTMVSLWTSSILYIIMTSVTALNDSVNSSYIPMLTKEGIDGAVASSQGFFWTNVGSILLLSIASLGTLFGYSLNTGASIGGLMTLLGVLVSCIYYRKHCRVEGAFEEDVDVSVIDKFSTWNSLIHASNYPEALKLCACWIFFTCSMTNFVINLNLLLQSSLESNTDIHYSGLILMSFISAALSLQVFRKLQPRSQSKNWFYCFYTITIILAVYAIWGFFLGSSFGLKHTWEFWVCDAIYIASSSSFRALMRKEYSQLIPDGYESRFFSLEIIGALIGTWITGLLSGLIQNHWKDGHLCFILSLISSLMSFCMFHQVDFEKGKDRKT